MGLPDATRLDTLPPTLWRALGERLDAIDLAAGHARLRAVGAGLFDPACRPLRRWHARRRATPADHALRMLWLADPVTPTEAAAALGPIDPAALVDAGLLVREADGRLVSPFRLHAYGSTLLFGDDLAHGGDAVMAGGPLTGVLVDAALPTGRVGRALDLGCGAGLVAIALARRADAVVATDVNPRAIRLARANLALAGAHHVELREGDLFEPLRGERFDLVASQPPFFPAPPGAGDAYSAGGPRGEEIPLRLLGGVAGHLAPGGRCVVAVEWPVWDDEPIAARLRRALPPRADLLVLASPGPDLDTFCMGDAAFAHGGFGPAYDAAVAAQRDHLAALGARGLVTTLTIVGAGAAGRDGFTASMEIGDVDRAGFDAAAIDRLLAAHDAIARGRDALLGATVRLRPDADLLRGRGPLVRVDLPRAAPAADLRLDAAAARLLETMTAPIAVKDALDRWARQAPGPRGAAKQRFLAAVEQAIGIGLIEIAPGR